MRHSIPISAALLLFCSCTNLLDYKSGQAQELIIMNAMLSTDETEHTVWLHRGLIDKVEALDNARLDCYINGTFAARAVPVRTSDHYDFNYSTYSFSAEIRPGDEVRLEATSGKLHASATVTAPQPATLVSVDTLTVTDSPYQNIAAYATEGSYYYIANSVSGQALSCNLKLQDRPGEANWYRLGVILEFEQQDRFPDHPARDRTRLMHYDWHFGFDLDPILSDGYTSQEAGIDSIIEPVYNYYCSFRDTRFSDGEATVEIHLSPFRVPVYVLYPGEEDDDRNVVHTICPRLVLRFLTLSEEAYQYLSAINRSQSIGYDWNVLTEPVPFPSNVEGGLGLVTVASASDRILEYPSYTIEGKISAYNSF